MAAPDPVPNIAENPLRAEAPEDYSDKMDVLLTSFNPMIDLFNLAITWVNARFNDIVTATADAAASESNAATSESNAGNSASAASDSAADALAHKNSTEVIAAAVQDASGLPSLVGKAGFSLKVRDDESGVDWISGETPTGDIVWSVNAAAHPVPHWLECNGNLYDTVTYSGLYALLGDSVGKLASVPAANGNGRKVAFSKGGNYGVLKTSTSPYLNLYKRTLDVFTKLANATGGNPNSSSSIIMDWIGDDYLLVPNTTTSPRVLVYNRTVDAFARMATGTVPNDATVTDVRGVAVDSTGTYMAVGGANAVGNRFMAYKISGETYTPIAVTGSMNRSCSDISWAGDDEHVLVVGGGGFSIVKRTGDAFEEVASVTASNNGTADRGHISPNGQFVILNGNSNNNVSVFKNDGDYTSWTEMNGLFSASQEVESLRFSSNGNIFMCGLRQAPFMETFNVDYISDTFTLTSFPAIPASGETEDLSWSGEYCLTAVTTPSPYIEAFKLSAFLPNANPVDSAGNIKAYIKTGYVAP